MRDPANAELAEPAVRLSAQRGRPTAEEAPWRSGVRPPRSFSHVADVVGAVLKLVVEPKAIGQVINIGNTQEITMRALAERVRELSGSSSPIKLIPYDEAYESGFEDMPRRVPDLTKIEGLIGYRPRYSLDDILAQVIEYFRNK